MLTGPARLLAVAAVLIATVCSAQVRSSLYPTNWTPGYADASGRFLHDFSYAGYHKGELGLPNPTTNVVNVTQSPYFADNTGVNDATVAIQNALDAVGSAGGGVVYLPAGTYKVSPQGANAECLRIRYSNVVLRGAGASSTKIFCDSATMRQKSVIRVEPNSAQWWYGGLNTVYATQDLNTPTDRVPVTSVANYTVGDLVCVRTDATQAFIDDHGMTGLWDPSDAELRGIVLLRRIKAVDAANTTLVLDAPTRYWMKTRDNLRVYELNDTYVKESGVEKLSIGMRQSTKSGWGDNDYNIAGTGAYDTHLSAAITFRFVEDCWARDVSSYQPPVNTLPVHVLSRGVLLDLCRQVTLFNCDFRNPQYEGGGGNGYLYTLTGNDCLIRQCTAVSGRHNYSFQFMRSSGNVIHGCTAKDGYLPADYHMYLSAANLIDNMTVDTDTLEAVYRPYGNPLHGQTTSQSVFWNTNGLAYTWRNYIIDSRQFGHGYVIGTRGPASAVSPSTNDFTEHVGNGANLQPQSLWQDQLARRLSAPANAVISAVSVTSGKTYPIEQGLSVGDKVYLEGWDAATYTTVPGEVAGAEFIQTSRNDHGDTGSSFMTLTLAQSATVYVGYRAGFTKPGWLNATWTDTGVNLDTSVGMHMRLYKKDFPAGNVVLGGNAQGGGSSSMMYVVAAKPAASFAVTNLLVVSGKAYQAVSGLGVGDKVYIEAYDTAIYSAVPSEVQGAIFIQTSRTDHTATASPFLTFNVSMPAKVYVAYRAGFTKPSWLDATWTDLGVNLDTSAGMHMRLYRKNFGAGTVSLGGNATGGGSSTMTYVVAVQPQ